LKEEISRSATGEKAQNEARQEKEEDDHPMKVTLEEV